MPNSPYLEQLRRDKMIAKATADLIRMHDGMNASVEEVRRMVAQYLAEAQRIQRLPKGDKGDRGERGFIGPDGRPGKDGKDGKDGFAPVKGKDYLTKGDEDLLVLRVLSRIKTPKDGETPVVDYDKIIEEAVEKLKGDKKLGWRDIDGLENELSSYRNQLARKQAGQHGGGDTIAAGTNITLVRNPNGTTTINASGGGGGVDSVVAGTGIDVDATDPANPVVALDSASQASLALADTALQTVAVDGTTITGNGTPGDPLVAVSGGGTPGGSNTQLQYNNAGAFGGISGATTNGTAITFTTGNLIGADFKAASSAGAQILSNAGTVTALFGAGGGANSTFYGGTKLDYATASTIAILDSSKNLISAATATYPDLTELSYVKGVTSAIQTQLNAKEVALTFSTGLTRATNTVTANISTGIAGSQTIYGGTAANEDLTIEGTTNATKTTSYVNLQPTGGFVGIGTTAPASKLNVETAASLDGIYLKGTSSGMNAALRLINDAGTYTQMFTVRSGGGGDAGKFFLQSNATTAMVIDTSQRVGIGSTSPAALLTLGTAGTKAGTLSFAGSTSGVITLQTAAAAGTYTLTFPTTDGNSGEFLQTDGSGVLTWAVPAGTGANTALSNLASVAINTTLVSDTDNTDDLGTSSVFWRTGYFKTSLELGATDTTITRSAAGIIAVEGVPVVNTTTAQTVTNKRNQPRTASSTSNANLDPDLATANVYFRTTQTTGLTIGAPTGTPVIGETIAIYVDSAGAQPLTINGAFVFFGSPPPGSTTAGKTFMLVGQYNGTSWLSTWANAV